jgi:hypothetical protein
MKNTIKTIAAIGISSMAIASFAADNACLMEGSGKIFDVAFETKECIQNNGLKKEEFLEKCNDLTRIKVDMGASIKLTYLDACPTETQGVCEGLYGPYNIYYYKRKPEYLEKDRSRCVKRGAKWRDS